MRSWIRWTGYGLALAAVVVSVILATRFGRDPGLVESPLIGKPAPEFELPPLEGDGDPVALSDLRGSIVVVNFFASWCLECELEHEDLLASAEAFGPTGVRFVQIGYQDRPQDASAWLDRFGRSEHTIYLHDPGSRTAIAYGVFGIPETFFIDPAGKVVGKIIGEADAFVIGATIDAIRRGETPGQSVTGNTQQRPDS
ncbi:MAG: redoxin domain-containing protein [Actinomycetes bacterium]|jgi:cytochrome c biogenesis protein CcmG/thiol:disulfide interchange protein DsbE